MAFLEDITKGPRGPIDPNQPTADRGSHFLVNPKMQNGSLKLNVTCILSLFYLLEGGCYAYLNP